MRTLNVSVNRDLLEQCVTLEHRVNALKKHEEQLNNLMSGEPVELSDKAKSKYKKAIVIGQARRGGLQSNYNQQLEIFKHRCEFPKDPKTGVPSPTCSQKHLEGWTRTGPTEEQREEAWKHAQAMRADIDRIAWDLENVRKEIGEIQNELVGKEREFNKQVFDAAKNVLSIAPAG